MIPLWRNELLPSVWENRETGSRANGPRSLTNHLRVQEVG